MPLVGGTELQEQREAKGDWGPLPGPPSLPTQLPPHPHPHLPSSSEDVLILHIGLVFVYKAHSYQFLSLILTIGPILHVEKLRANDYLTFSRSFRGAGTTAQPLI